jgi:hypothetical protein
MFKSLTMVGKICLGTLALLLFSITFHNILNFGFDQLLRFNLAQISGGVTTYYVDNAAGDDLNSGTSQDQAWKTIAKVNGSSFRPGDQILFKRGGVWREQLTIPSSGVAGNPITYGAYGSGAKPIITGADTVTNWTQREYICGGRGKHNCSKSTLRGWNIY